MMGIIQPSPLSQLLLLLAFGINLLILFILADVIFSYLVMFSLLKATNPMVRFVRTIVTPVLNPLRTLIPPRLTNGWDFSPFLAIVLLDLLANIVSRW